jgi:glycerophosphoryl diester phosphodiesterase
MFNLQGHRGARGLKPENTLPSFEAALDAGVTSVETDLHLTRDGHLVLFHDPQVTSGLCRPAQDNLPPTVPADGHAISQISLAQLRHYRADRNPHPDRFPNQDPGVTPLAGAFAGWAGMHAYAPPTLPELFAFVDDYAGERGRAVGKTDKQRAGARRLVFDLELKRVPFYPRRIGDHFDGHSPALLEGFLLEAVRQHGLLDRVVVRSFDHRCVLALKQLEPRLRTAILVAGTAPVDPVGLVRQAEASIYCPDYQFLDVLQVRQLQDAGIAVLPWTVNDESDWERLLTWGVDGITTDYPDRLARFLG